jgi:nucleoside-diphosphate-sugar epimerase
MGWSICYNYSRNGVFLTHRILITGATGFVGRQVLKALQNQTNNITLVVRPGWKDKVENPKGIAKVFETKDLFKESAKWWANTCKNIDIIIHLAWYLEPGKYFMSDKNLDCLTGTLNLAKGAIEASVRRFIGIGTCLEYDLKSGILSIDTPLMPLTPYAATKAAAYLALSQLLFQKNIEFAWCRLFYLYGDGENKKRLVPYIRNQIKIGQAVELTSGNQIRDFMDVKDAGKKIALVSISHSKGPINICSGIPITVREIAEKIADEYGRRDLLKFGVRQDNLTDPNCVIGEA